MSYGRGTGWAAVEADERNTRTSPHKGAGLRSLMALALIFALVTESFADVCVWRDPEKTMSKLFPAAKDYKSIDRKISPEKREAIERRLGRPLDPGEREDWIYYRLTDAKGQTLGFVIADAEKGEYGVIEIVMGITTDGKVKAVYVQKARERNKEFKSPEFLTQFAGKTHQDAIQIGKDIHVKERAVAANEVAFAVRKMLVFYDELAP
jgi:hypothetical protein